VELLEVFKDFKVYILGGSQFGRYRALYELVPSPNPKPITVDSLEAYVRRLQSRYPDGGFKLDVKRIGSQTFYIVNKKSYVKTPDGRKRMVRDRVPIYFDLEAQKVYVPRWYVKNRRRLASYILMRTLGALGYATVKYKETLGRR